MELTLTSLSRLCRNQFCDILGLPSGCQTQRISDDYGRFQIWAGNIGALRTGLSSLDDRLSMKEASPMVTRLKMVLSDLNASLVEGKWSYHKILHKHKVMKTSTADAYI